MLNYTNELALPNISNFGKHSERGRCMMGERREGRRKSACWEDGVGRERNGGNWRANASDFFSHGLLSSWHGARHAGKRTRGAGGRRSEVEDDISRRHWLTDEFCLASYCWLKLRTEATMLLSAVDARVCGERSVGGRREVRGQTVTSERLPGFRWQGRFFLTSFYPWYKTQLHFQFFSLWSPISSCWPAGFHFAG